MKQFIGKDFPRLLDLLYDAALNVERWPRFLDALLQPFGAASGGLDLFDRRINATRRFLNFGSDPAFTASYAQHYVAVNPYPAAAFLQVPVGKVVSAADVLKEEDIAGTEFFNDWMRPQGISPSHLRIVLQKDKDSMVLLAVSPHEHESRRSLDKYAKKLELLAPHLVRAIALNRVASWALLSERAIGESLRAFAAAAFLLERSGRIVAANARGEALMRDERVLRLDPMGRLQAARTADDGDLKAAIAKAHTAPGLAQSPVRVVSCRSGRTWLAWIVPSRAVSGEEACERFRLMELQQPSATVLVLVTPTDAGANVPVESIIAAFGLSAAQARLVSALGAGRTLAEYASETGHSRNTARNQLAAVFEKTGTHRQSELLALVAGSLGAAARASGAEG
jgi:DNA-binding CsgD family transcriptional regulator